MGLFPAFLDHPSNERLRWHLWDSSEQEEGGCRKGGDVFCPTNSSLTASETS